MAVYVRPAWFEPLRCGCLAARLVRALRGCWWWSPAVLVRLDYTFERLDHARVRRSRSRPPALLSAVPFLAAGIAIALAIKALRAPRSDRVYAFDLAGAGLGALAVVPADVDASPRPLLLAALGLLGGAGGSAARGDPRTAGAPAALALVAGSPRVAVRCGAATHALSLPTRSRARRRRRPLDAAQPRRRLPAVDGDASLGLVTYDRVYAPVPVHRPRRAAARTGARSQLGPQSIGYALTRPGRALVIGGGGGRDIHNALSSGRAAGGRDRAQPRRSARSWTTTSALLGSALQRCPGSTSRSATGARRSPRSDARYDQIHIGFTDTLSAQLGAGASPSTENNLYTVEAFDEYLDHLAPGGVLNVSRDRRLVGDEALRATVLTLEALAPPRRRGPGAQRRGDPRREDLFDGDFGTVLARLEPFTRGRAGASCDASRTSAASGVAYRAGRPVPRGVGRARRAPSLAGASATGYRLDVCPPTDDKPFFFNLRARWADLGRQPDRRLPVHSLDPLLVLLVDARHPAGALSVLAFVLPLLLVRGAAAPRRRLARASSPRSALGFLVLEVVADPALRAVPRLPDLRALGRAVRAAPVHGAGRVPARRAGATRAAR